MQIRPEQDMCWICHRVACVPFVLMVDEGKPGIICHGCLRAFDYGYTWGGRWTDYEAITLKEWEEKKCEPVEEKWDIT